MANTIYKDSTIRSIEEGKVKFSKNRFIVSTQKVATAHFTMSEKMFENKFGVKPSIGLVL